MKRKWSIFLLFFTALTLHAQNQPRFAGKGIAIGIEYCLLDNQKAIANKAVAYADMGLSAAKLFPEHIAWGAMQKGPNQAIDFSKLDAFVREYQKNGFTQLVICLKPHSEWGSKDYSKYKSNNATPKPEYIELFENWVKEVIERYDGDGISDMPGLLWPVNHVEIGSEFSSYQPEPAHEYIETLRRAYNAAHKASSKVIIGHSAFLITPVNFNEVKDPSQYEEVWEKTPIRDKTHDLQDIRLVLDHPEIFDVINFHNLGDPYEIEGLVKWAKYEMGQRGYSKPMIISDTLATSYIGWGPATICEGPKQLMGVLGSPATEQDRCRLAAYFKKLIAKDLTTLHWTYGFVAADHVQRAIIAAEQGIKVINLAFTSDMTFLTWKAAQAGAGISAWGGAVEVNHFNGIVSFRRPLFYAIKQLMEHISGYSSIKRLEYGTRARVYEIVKNGKKFWIVWRNPKAVLLPEDGKPSMSLQLATGTSSVLVEPVITKVDQTGANQQQIACVAGKAYLTLTHTPMYVFAEN